MATKLGANGVPYTIQTTGAFTGSFICIGGTWKQISEVYICIGGVWKSLDQASICIATNWKTVE